jgi:hypothetical protein
MDHEMGWITVMSAYQIMRTKINQIQLSGRAIRKQIVVVLEKLNL